MPRAEQVLQSLLAGNKRFIEARATHPHQSPERRAEIARGQHPLAVILGCSDSRVPPEIVFDQGLGDLFVVRTPGNLVDDALVGGLEYAAGHLGVVLILVLGHSRCAAVEAALHPPDGGTSLASLLGAIRPAVERVRGLPGDPLENAVRAHIEAVVARLRASRPGLTDLWKEGRLAILGGRYDLDTGEVEIIA